MKYNDFKIRFLKPYINQEGNEIFPISVESPAGNDQGELTIPFSADEMKEQLISPDL